MKLEHVSRILCGVRTKGRQAVYFGDQMENGGGQDKGEIIDDHHSGCGKKILTVW